MFKLRHLLLLCVSHYVLPLTTLTVTLSSDDNPGGMGEIGDLRYCINTMNESLQTTFDDYAITFVSPMTITLNGILPIINNSSNPVNITIGNPGNIPTVTIDGNSGRYSGFFIPIGNVTIQNMIFQNLTARGGYGGDGNSGGGGGLGAGGAIYAPQFFLHGSNPAITLINVSINNCSAIGGDGGSYFITIPSITGDEGGGGGGGFSGNGGFITVTGRTGGGGGGGFGGNGGDVTLSADNAGGGGAGGGGIGSRAILGIVTNRGNGGSDQNPGDNGSGYHTGIVAGQGAQGNNGGNDAGGGGGGVTGGGGGGSDGFDGEFAEGTIPPGGSAIPSGGNGGDGGGGGGASVVMPGFSNIVDGQAGSGGYGGGGGGGSGTGSYDANYTVQGGSGGFGAGGGGGGVNQSGLTPALGGNSLGGGGGAGGGPSNGSNAPGGTDIGNLGGGSGGIGADSVGSNFGGGGGGGGSGLGAAIFVDSGLNFTIRAFSGIPTTFNTTDNTTQAGVGGLGGPGGGQPGTAGSALGNSIFLRAGSFLTLVAQNPDDLLILGEQVAFADDTIFGTGGTSIFVRGNGTVVYNGTTDYSGRITINNANFKVNGSIDNPSSSISVCRDINTGLQRGTLSGTGILNGNVLVNSGAISPDTGATLSIGSLTLQSADLINGSLGSLVHIEIDPNAISLVAVNDVASLAGILEIDLDPSITHGTYIILTATSGITGTFDSVTFTGQTPNYTLSYLPINSPTFVQFDFLGYPPRIAPPQNLQGEQKENNFGFTYELYNQLTWSPSPSLEITGYFIYRDGQKIATVAGTTHIYQDHNRQRGVSSLYALITFDSDGNTSSPVTVIVP